MSCNRIHGCRGQIATRRKGHSIIMPTVLVAATNESIRAAAAHLRAGRLVAFPTETVYGLGADARNAEAVARIFAAKGRPSFNPLIVHVADTTAASKWAELTPAAEKLAAAFWPGGLTMVLARREDSLLSDLVSAGLPSIAIRVPAHPVAQMLLREADCPIAAPSANKSGRVSPTTAAHVAADYDAGSAIAPAMILDGGAAPLGIESTIVDARHDIPVLLRPGAVTSEAIEAIIGSTIALQPRQALPGGAAARTSPGQLDSHYAPEKPVVMNVARPRPDQALIVFGTPPANHTGEVFNLSPTGDLIEAAANLFQALRQLDATKAVSIAVMPIPETGLGIAINDRLRRAAAPRTNP
jgi:L-threonylcarbamoyladenylate synthase